MNITKVINEIREIKSFKNSLEFDGVNDLRPEFQFHVDRLIENIKVPLVVCFSGGRTSAYMSYQLKTAFSQYFDLKFVFINTSAEDLRTLDFVDRCDKEFDLNLTWIEARIHKGRRKSSTYAVTNYENAKRKHELFYDMAEKYGVPNKAWPHCTRELKNNPVNAWIKDNAKGAHRAIGIRNDEIDRMSLNHKKDKVIYPLISLVPTSKEEVLLFWARQKFNLNVPEHRGNCVTCWKKSDRKIKTLIHEDEKLFAHFNNIEKEAPQHSLPHHRLLP